MVMRLIV
jgi:hypothetical protein